MRKDITGLVGFILYFILVMFLPLIDFEMSNGLCMPQEGSFLGLLITLFSAILTIPFLLKLQWLILILTVPKIKKYTKSLFLINLLTNLKLNYIILGIGVIFDICIWKFLPHYNWSHLDDRVLYWGYLSFTSNYIIVFLMVLLDENNISLKQTVKNFLNNLKKRLSNALIVKSIINFKYFNQLKNILGLVGFILFFILVMFLPLINLKIFDYTFLKENESLLLVWAWVISIILFILFTLKLQWLILLLTIHKLRKITQNPLLISLFTNHKLNNIILCYGLLFDVCMCIYAQDFINKYFPTLLFYIFDFSFTSNYIVVYLNALPECKKT